MSQTVFKNCFHGFLKSLQVCVCWCVCGSQRRTSDGISFGKHPSSGFACLLFETGFDWGGQIVWPARSRDSPVSCSPELWLQTCTSLPSFKHGIWGSDCPSIIHIFPLSCFFSMFFIVSFIYPWTMLFRTPHQEPLIIVMKTIFISVIVL